ncbi:hypothetical protein RO3G_04300 [Rhizopus delemar RA 99-880]|uniref:Uncharacterized protein n=1 Tax=Rhizopus delemar (strain RA 99-880 / ATCC MYA-4621 / FGSC 9543 / NRRL 43880) TaxID=246409 RepID=I1BTR5_RHIO9|nr:hypothetical protein RO3G_04300 [Rhizopus delemar RA 99-880]|eukprot:EIE79595.1 hypothetical protein RO3G_04300 [Rhizopus delemar RA 99-880]
MDQNYLKNSGYLQVHLVTSSSGQSIRLYQVDTLDRSRCPQHKFK